MRTLRFAIATFVLALPLEAAAQTPAASPSPKPAASPSPSAAPAPAPTAELAPSHATSTAPGPLGEDFHGGSAEATVQGLDVDTVSSKFLEYRDVPTGVAVPSVRAFGEKDRFRYDLLAEGVRQADEHYRGLLGHDSFRLGLDFRRIPHRFGNEGRTLLAPTSEGVLEMSDTLQGAFQGALEKQFAANPNGINFTFLSGLVSPSLADGNVVDLELERQRSRVDLELLPGRDFSLHVNYFHERRTGDRAAAGTSFGFGNVVETPEPVHYLTQDVSAVGSLERKWGSARAGLGYNRFDDRLQSETCDNPFRAVDSIGSSSSPNSSSIGGPTQGRMALPPDNEAFRGFGGATVRLPGHTRLMADLSLARWRQNDTFIPYSTNTAITSPLNASNPATLPTSSLDGRIGVFSQSYTLTSRPRLPLQFTARYRDYDVNNDTPRISFPGYVQFDETWQTTGRISVPYGYHSRRFDATGAYDFDRLNVELGYHYNGFDRTFRETGKTTENTVSVAANLRLAEWSSLRGTYEHGSRGFDHYDFAHSEEASFVSPGTPTQQPLLRRYDQAARDLDRVTALVQGSPGDKFSFSAFYRLNNEDYDLESGLGLSSAHYSALGADVDYTPSARWSLFGYYSHENGEGFLLGRQSGSTPSVNSADDWSSRITDKTDTVGAGANIQLVPDRWTLNLSGRYQNTDGFNDLFSPPGGSPDVAFPISDFDDTRLVTLTGELRYAVSHGWRLSLGTWWEDYRIRDSQTQNTGNYAPSSFLLNANDGDYKAIVAYVGVTRSW